MNKILSIILLGLLLGCSGKHTEDKHVPDTNYESKKPNILLIVIDDLGYADFKPFSRDSGENLTPNMAKLAESGTIYSQAYVTAPVCSPSRVGMITGMNQFRWDKPASWGPGLPEQVKTIAEYLKEYGYATARIGKNDLGRNFHNYEAREYPTNHGYDEFLGFSAHAHDYWLNSKEIKEKTPDPSGTSAVLGPLMHNDSIKSYSEGYLTDILTDEAIDYLNKDRDKPFFLTLGYSAVHHLIHEVPKKYLDKYEVAEIPNYDPSDTLSFKNHPSGSYAAYYDNYSRIGAIDEPQMRKYYMANLNSLDDNIGKLWNAMQTSKLMDNTVIIFISDNGGSPLTGANNAPLTAGKYSLWEGGIRVPMAISYPKMFKAGKINNDIVSALDILPTVAELTGMELNSEYLDGKSLLDSTKDDRSLIWRWQKTWAIRKGDYKLTNANENHWKSEPSNQYIAPIADNLDLKLFNLNSDPEERNNLASEYPDVVKNLQKEYDDWMEKNRDKF